MKKNFLNKKIPTILGLAFLIAGAVFGIYFVSQGKLFGFKGSLNAEPKKIKITNVDNNRFTVSWTTEEKNLGLVKYGKTTQLKNTAYDDRNELSSEAIESNVHYTTIKSLEPSTTYYFKILSAGVLYDNSGQPFSVTTGPSLGSAGQAKIVNGRILNQDNNPASETIVYLSSNNIAPLSTLIDKEGRWVIFLNNAKVSDLSSYAIFDPEATILKIDVEAGDQNASAVTITKNAFPVPDIVLGHVAYDFKQKPLAKKPEAGSQPIPKKEEALPQFTLQPDNSPTALPSQQYELTIENPAENNEQINTSRPEFKGKGPFLKVLTVRIESPSSYSTSVNVNEEGLWSYVSPQDLTPGEHSVYVSYLDDEGTTRTISRNFVVLAAETSDLPALTSTPSAQMSPSPSPIFSPSPSPSPSQPDRVSIPSTDTGVPTTGTVLPTFIVFLTGLIILTISFLSFTVIDKDNKIWS